ncbi:protein lifeguard 4-like isoform X2 [Branchiostoma floridae]|uniref:Protein lifeguard 4-like isoform X2 n=1 Tax=Branchiostoma floridae TaxID=7739 RepID=A0A9J7L602_BRAFL|nr:protein lifeguard 4-like isoform X2 [Branchiostoma floridae]
MATSVPLPTFVANPEPSGKGQSSIMDDFMYGTNVASSHVYIRMAFLRKVYGILSMQLALTTIMGALFIYTPAIKTFVQGSPNLLMLALFLSLGILVALHIKRTEYPTNMYLLAAFTFVEAYSIGTVVTFYDQAIVLQAFALTLSVCVGLTLYTLQSKKDYSSWGAGLFSALWILVIAGFLHLFFPRNDIMRWVWRWEGPSCSACSSLMIPLQFRTAVKLVLYISQLFFPRNDIMEMGLAVGGAILFCL